MGTFNPFGGSSTKPAFTKPQGYQPMAGTSVGGMATSMPQKPPFAGVMPIGPGRGYPTMMPPVGIGGGLAFGSGYGSPGLGLVPGAQMGAVRNLQAQMPQFAGLGGYGGMVGPMPTFNPFIGRGG